MMVGLTMLVFDSEGKTIVEKIIRDCPVEWVSPVIVRIGSEYPGWEKIQMVIRKVPGC